MKIVHKKSQTNHIFYRLKKGGQVIDPTVAKLLTLKWPKCGQLIDPTAYIYIPWADQERKVGIACTRL